PFGVGDGAGRLLGALRGRRGRGARSRGRRRGGGISRRAGLGREHPLDPADDEADGEDERDGLDRDDRDDRPGGQAAAWGVIVAIAAVAAAVSFAGAGEVVEEVSRCAEGARDFAVAPVVAGGGGVGRDGMRRRGAGGAVAGGELVSGRPLLLRHAPSIGPRPFTAHACPGTAGTAGPEGSAVPASWRRVT